MYTPPFRITTKAIKGKELCSKKYPIKHPIKYPIKYPINLVIG